jgi:hypothetical protein
LGPYILCAVMLAKSTFMASTSKSIFPHALHCVGVKQNALLARDLSDLSDTIDGADFVVCKHH